jgi:hypothetical protein
VEAIGVFNQRKRSMLVEKLSIFETAVSRYLLKSKLKSKWSWAVRDQRLERELHPERVAALSVVVLACRERLEALGIV